MSSSDYRLNLIWSSHGQQFQADLERNIGQLARFQGGMRQSGQQMGLWGQQMKAVSTTLRYALSGALIYGAASAVSGLGAFSKRLGEIDSLAAKVDSKGKLRSIGADLDQVGTFAIKMSNKFGVAVDDVQQSMIAFYSSFDAPKGKKGLDQMEKYVEVMQQLNLITEGADPTAMARGLASLSIASGRGPSAAGNFRDIIASVISQSPVIRGEDIARDAGRLAAAQTASGMTPEQVFATYLMASKSGGSGAQIGRGVSTLLQQSIVNPSSKKAKEAFQSIGLPTDPNALQAMGGMNVLKRLMAATITGPVKFRNRGALGDENLDDSAAISGAGATGVNISLASRLIPQQWALRQFLGMLARGGPEALDKFVKSLQQAEKNHLGVQRARIVQEQSTLQRTNQAQKNLFLQLTRGLSPVLTTGGRAIIGASDAANALGPTGTVAVAGGAIAAKLLFGGMAAKGLGNILSRGGIGGKMLGKMGLGNLLGRAPELGSAALIGSGVGAFSSTGMGDTGAGGRNNPFWVVIDPISWFMPGSPSGIGGGSGGGGTTPVGWWSKGKAGLKTGFKGELPALAGAAAAPVAVGGAGLLWGNDVAQWISKGLPSVHTGVAPIDWFFRPSGQSTHRRSATRHAQAVAGGNWMDQFLTSWPGAAMPASRRAGSQTGGVTLSGDALMTIVLDASPALKKALMDLDQKHHVPVKLWPKGGGGSPPQSRGKQKAHSGSAGGR